MPLENILGKTMDELFPSDLAKKMIEDDKEILNKGKLVNVNEEFNGRYYYTIKFPIHLDNKPPMLAGFTMDITKNKRMEKEIKNLVENNAFGRCITDDQGVVLNCNEKVAAIIGDNKESVIGKSLFDLQPDRRDIYQNIIETAAKKKEIIQYKTLYQTQNEEIQLLVTISPIYVGDELQLQIITQNMAEFKTI